MQASPDNICTLILAGGQGRRMQNQDKGLVKWRGKAMIEHSLMHIPGHCIVISANRNIEHYQNYGYPVITDTYTGYQCPLAGLLAAMQQTSSEYILSLPCDSPQPPDDLQTRLINSLNQQHKTCAICHDGERLQPLFALISRQHVKQLEDFLAQGNRQVRQFFSLLEPAICDFSDQPEGFYNFNRAEDLL